MIVATGFHGRHNVALIPLPSGTVRVVIRLGDTCIDSSDYSGLNAPVRIDDDTLHIEFGRLLPIGVHNGFMTTFYAGDTRGHALDRITVSVLPWSTC